MARRSVRSTTLPDEGDTMIFGFDDIELDTELFELRRAGERVPIEPQVFEVLRYLLEHRDRLVTKNDLLDSMWGDRYVSESTFTP